MKYNFYGNVQQELNRHAALLLAEGKITKEQYEEILKANKEQANEVDKDS